MKLIILNGPPGTGKSTISQKLHQELPMSILVDIDQLRRWINGYRENKKQSGVLGYELAKSVIASGLESGSDIIVDKVILDSDVIDSIIKIGKDYKADTYEFILSASKEATLARADKRGYRPGSLLTKGKVRSMWKEGQELLKKRIKKAIVIDTTDQDIEETYNNIKTNIGI